MTSQGYILVTGASGFLGEAVLRHLAANGVPAVGAYGSRPVVVEGASTIPLDIEDAGAVRRIFRDLRPRATIHCAALTDVAACQADPIVARRVNVDATASLLAAASVHTPEAPFLFTSTDLAFDGTRAPYSESDAPSPLSEYARSKVEAEALVLRHPTGVVLRVALLFGPPGSHRAGFLGWMLGTLAKRERLTLFEDEFRTPVCTLDVAGALASLALRPIPGGGVLHAAGPERLSRLAMGRIACEAFGLDAEQLVASRLAQSVYAAPRPADVSLRPGRLGDFVPWAPRTLAAFLAGMAGRTQPRATTGQSG